MVKVFRYRVKSLNGLLNKQSRAVNFVWNFCNDTQKFALKWHKRWPTGFDLNKLTTGSGKKLTTGSGKELGLHAGTINATCEQYAKSRAQKKRPYLRYRGKKSLGWVPFKGRDLKPEGNAFRFHGNTFRAFYSRPLPEGKIKDGSCFARDARGRWFLNVVIEVADTAPREIKTGVGIDLGLKDFAALSTGQKIANPRPYRTLEAKPLSNTGSQTWPSPTRPQAPPSHGPSRQDRESTHGLFAQGSAEARSTVRLHRRGQCKRF